MFHRVSVPDSIFRGPFSGHPNQPQGSGGPINPAQGQNSVALPNPFSKAAANAPVERPPLGHPGVHPGHLGGLPSNPAVYESAENLQSAIYSGYPANALQGASTSAPFPGMSPPRDGPGTLSNKVGLEPMVTNGGLFPSIFLGVIFHPRETHLF